MEYRERILLIPKNVDEMLEKLLAKYESSGIGGFRSEAMSEFLLFLLDTGARKAEADLDKMAAPLIALPSIDTSKLGKIRV